MRSHGDRPRRPALTRGSRKTTFLLLLLLLGLPDAASSQSPLRPARFLTGAGPGDPRERVEDFVRSRREDLGLEAADLQDWVLVDRSRSKSTGLTHLYYRQRLAGIEVQGGTLSSSVMPDGRLLALEHRFVRNLRGVANVRAPGITATEAVGAAAAHLGLTPTAPLEVRERRGGPARETLLGEGGISLDPIPAKLVYWPDPAGGARLAWSVFVRMTDGLHWWNLLVDAVTGDVLSQTDWILNDSYNVFALPLEDPDEGAQSIETDPAGASSPHGWHDTDGSPGAETSDTSGNNVTAQEDADGNDGTGTRPTDPGLDFDFTFDPSPPPSASQSAAITNLFYWNNVLHDIHHVYGFDEASGNFQVNNYGNGGLGGDPVLADAQDGSGVNNANFSRASDGSSPRMQMFLFEFPGVQVHAPGSIAQTLAAGTATFGPAITLAGLTDDVVRADPNDACTALLNPDEISGKIALIDRGTCLFVDKVANAQAAGATGAIIANNVGDEAILMGGTDPTLSIPSMFIGQSHGEMLAAEIESGVNVTLTSRVQRDGDFDNGIIIHEYGHGVSIRLTGGPSSAGCLSLAQSGGMGEGWGDWWALALTALPGDDGSDLRGIAAFASGEGPDGPGIRNFPYSTDTLINPLTLSSIDITNQPHGVGEVWAQALWEVYWVLVGEYGFDPDLYSGSGGNNLALQLVMDGLKIQDCEPTFLDARDAIFQADVAANAGANACLLWQAFAKRGMGTDADDTGNVRRTDATDGFSVPTGCEPVCGNASVDLGESCDDGGTSAADGCSGSCRVETFVALFGTADGGSVSLLVDGVSIQVTTTPGQSAADVLAALAAAINADPTLQGLGTTAAVSGSNVAIDGEVSDVTIGDPGLSGEPIPASIPALAPQAVALLIALLSGGLLVVTRSRRS